jgi:glycosyltransferase involved in cell wall biosynthesis
MKLSIIMPGIRVKNWLNVYQSIPNTTALPKEEYELVIVSPYNLPPELQDLDNVRLIKDKGCPTRCHQLGLLHSKGEYVVWGADDGVMLPGLAIDKAFASLPQGEKGLVSMRYGESYKAAKLEKLSWWRMKNFPLLRRLKHLPNHYMLIMIALIRRDYLMKIGGWDCRFEQPGISSVDLAVRLQNDGAPSVLGEKMWHFGAEEFGGSQTPVVEAHKLNDTPLLVKIYNHKFSIGRSKIDFDNWKEAEDVWSRRTNWGEYESSD